jgi:hypothetical protein
MFQVSVFGKSYREMETLAASVRSALDEYTGVLENVNIERCSFYGENYIPEGTGVHHKAIDFQMTVKRNATVPVADGRWVDNDEWNDNEQWKEN